MINIVRYKIEKEMFLGKVKCIKKKLDLCDPLLKYQKHLVG